MDEKKDIFCTVFDKNYLIQGLALYRSLELHESDFTLYCLALDDVAADTLKKLKLKSLRVVTPADLPQELVQRAKSQMSWPQFCWTMQPLICSYVLNLGEPEVTYLEADSYFFSSPKTLLKEIGDRSVSVVPHAFSPEAMESEKTSGIYCVQFNYFRNDVNARACLASWQESCFEYRKEAPTLFPGQTCLDLWESRFSGVAVIQNPGAGVAPWNMQKYRITEGPRVDGVPVVFYHYHQFARDPKGNFDLGSYPMRKEVVDYLYMPYMKAILSAEAEVRSIVAGFNFRRQVPTPVGYFQALKDLVTQQSLSSLKIASKPLRDKLKGITNYNRIKLSQVKAS